MKTFNRFLVLLAGMLSSCCISEGASIKDTNAFSWQCNNTMIHALHLGEEYFIERVLFPSLGLTGIIIRIGSLAARMINHVYVKTLERLSVEFFKELVLSLFKKVAEEIPFVHALLDALNIFNNEIASSVCRTSGFMIDRIADKRDFPSLFFKNYFSRLTWIEKLMYWFESFITSIEKDWEFFYNELKRDIEGFVN
ncbi:uncharacterized protein LOC133198666 [Saccostrea echinata]|uniref:uncharacterized protein LOC133198666 n=1 Tax=Saccostrea echinata TaxID=191078 RepID=UPI002A80F1D6|nr:uncharacterized protein LOC133198666 [Saccostrea echinata]